MPEHIRLDKRSLSERLRHIADMMMETAQDPIFQTEDLLPLSHRQMAIAISLTGIAEEIDARPGTSTD